MSEGPILHLYKYGRKTELNTDACKQGYGAIWLQEAEDGKLHPVYYMSKKTNTAEENISEDYAKNELNTRIARWALQLEEFDYEIEHRAGSRMKHVDALSRYPVMMESIPLSTYHVDFIGPLPSTNKRYQHIFTVVDAFTKFTWLYPVKTVSAESSLEKTKTTAENLLVIPSELSLIEVQRSLQNYSTTTVMKKTFTTSTNSDRCSSRKRTS
ncbi:retrovirus-related Pol polyprotein from transposon 17.6 [Trichonephila clavipes]|nr:retrovirus-related Pol polyprotein from transposon 17.6 [Trichonephila clavipes]